MAGFLRKKQEMKNKIRRKTNYKQKRIKKKQNRIENNNQSKTNHLQEQFFHQISKENTYNSF